jgi:RNA-directed DNA polymerase
VALNGLEQQLARFLETTLGVNQTRKLKVNVVRYADDFVITGSTPEVLETR